MTDVTQRSGTALPLGKEREALCEFPGRVNDDGITPLAFYAFVVRKLGIPATFRLTSAGEWCADAPYTKPPKKILDLLKAHGV